jgi:protein involved in polysaccharide export with SLBB domain
MHILSLIKAPVRWNLYLPLALLILGLAGCATPNYQAEMETPTGATNAILPKLNVGDTVTVSFAGIDDPPLPQEKPITDDGTITLPAVGRIQAAGKTPGEMEQIIHDRYVPAIYTHLDITVKASGDRVYFVRGEVKGPNRFTYVGPITVTKAITSAGDFTDFANRRDVWLIRSSGKRFKLNCNKILDGEAPDPPVFPGDQIEVRRKIF